MNIDVPAVFSQEPIKQSRLPWALGIAIILTLILTGVSMTVYYVAGFNKLDLSRPDYVQERKAVTTDGQVSRSYDTTSPVSKQTLEDFLKEFDSRTKSANAYSDFKEGSLNDEDLGLTP